MKTDHWKVGDLQMPYSRSYNYSTHSPALARLAMLTWERKGTFSDTRIACHPPILGKDDMSLTKHGKCAACYPTGRPPRYGAPETLYGVVVWYTVGVWFAEAGGLL